MGKGTLPTSLRVSQYFTAVLLASSALVFFESPTFGFAYLAAAASVLVPLHAFRVPRRYYFTVLLAAGTIWLTHLIRPMVLFVQPEGFLYPRIISLDGTLVTSTLLRIAVMGFALLAGLVAGYRLLGGREAGSTDEEGRRPLLLSLRSVVQLALVGGVLFKAVTLLAFGVGFRSGAPDPVLSILSRFVPDYLIYGLVVLYLGKYRHRITPAERLLHLALLGAMATLGLLQGSKAFIAQILLALFVFYLAFEGDFRVKVRHAALLGVAGVVVLVASFPLAMSLRRYVQTEGYNLGAVSAAARGLAEVARPEEAATVAAWISSRFIGFDGMLATEASLPPEFLQTFGLTETLHRVQGRLIPLDEGTGGSLSTGRAVSTYLIGHPEELRHSGGVGLFAASRFMGGPVGGVLIVFLFGLGWAAYFSLSDRVRSSDARFLLRYVGVNGIIFWTMSGNADYLVPVLVITVGEILFLGVALRHLQSAFR